MDELDAWCSDRMDKLLQGMETYVMSGGNMDDAQYRQRLGQHQAYAAMRSHIHRARAALTAALGDGK